MKCTNSAAQTARMRNFPRVYLNTEAFTMGRISFRGTSISHPSDDAFESRTQNAYRH